MTSCKIRLRKAPSPVWITTSVQILNYNGIRVRLISCQVGVASLYFIVVALLAYFPQNVFPPSYYTQTEKYHPTNCRKIQENLHAKSSPIPIIDRPKFPLKAHA